MSLQEFVDFYKTPKEDRKVLYNVLSLEYSLTPLEDLVDSPALVREIDWVGKIWPDALRQRWISFNGRDKKLYTPHHTFPKVQNYCLMSVANCYTDFHIDFSGTSVWYHVLKGRKVFWLIPPTETNFFLYQEFIKTVSDNSFFGYTVEHCHVAILEPGDTMLIPSGWIHAVYTPDDSLVFGGNFLHSLSCQTQIRVFAVENKLNISRKFRLPYNEELIFYVMADYVKKWTGREYVRPLRIEDAKLDYVGEKWQTAGGHLKKIVYSDYAYEVTNDMVNTEEVTTKDEVKVIAMHAENSGYGGSPMISKSTFTEVTGLEEEADDEDDSKPQETKEEMEARRDAEIDELASSNSLIFYKNSKHDFIRNKCVPDHKLPIGHEPPIYFNDDAVASISSSLLDELEALGAYMRKKGRVEVAEGICQPASLINVFNTVLRKRRAELEGTTFEFNQVMPRRYTRAAIETGGYDFEPTQTTTAGVSRRNSQFKVEDFPDELLEGEEPERPRIILPQQPSSGPLEYIPTERVIHEDANGFEEEYDEDYGETKQMTVKEDVEDDAEEEPEEEDDDGDEEYKEEKYVAPVTRRSSSRKSTSSVKKEEKEEGVLAEETPKKVKKEKKEKTPKSEKKEEKIRDENTKEPKKDKREKEKKKKEMERRMRDSQLEAELRAAHGGVMSKSKKKKPEKPAYVGGLPTAPIQNDPVVSNPYNYDPRMEMMKLGTGQLKSAYRKTKNNVELHIEKNLYKLDPKRESQEGSESREQSVEPTPSPEVPYDRYSQYHTEEHQHDDLEIQRPPAKRSKYESISVDTVETPTSSKRKEPRPKAYTPTSITSPTSSNSHKHKISSPAMMSPVQEHTGRQPKTNERRLSDPTAIAMKKGVYMPPMSRQDKMIADEPSASSSRHSSISSERRQSFIPDFNSSRHSSIDAYSPTVQTPMRTSWIPNSYVPTRRSLDDDFPIDVVNDSHSPIDVVNSPPFPTSVTPPPVTLSELNREMSNGKKRHNHHHRHSEEGRKPKISAKDAISELKILVNRLKTINDS
ncbi:hypothetical protein GCK72_010702 [Caenorhabditis remanei]|uniref:JmjC domain-containing protein n=1 Tax=Caenorhabditis remanei TaxID=31234 RepID=A0A6A5H3K7_CAERE|nr:hypothetical protein GCK72_010702 [Caenorhabditis remanei]KAF1762440.1 hypothetical protein GCK72_010702 [Caenorhabditis remanei]